MKQTKSKRRGGWPDRKRHAFVVRIDPALASWLSEVAAKSGRSRSALVEGWLASLRAVVEESERCKEWPSPSEAIKSIGAALVGEMIRNGLTSDFVLQTWRLHVADQEAMVRELTKDRKGKS